MWSDWRADIVEADFKKLHESGLTVLRIFPLWPVFQPITLLKGGMGTPVEYRFGENLIPDTEAGRAGIDESAIEKFKVFLDLAEKYKLQLIVGLVTGWMSGRLFVPPALEEKNVLSDPIAMMWETRMVKYIVKHFKNHPAIVAWDLGNECNCMAHLNSSEEAYVWSSTISNAIKSEDVTHPVISGMHSLSPEKIWRIEDQAEVLDILTTHPYPYFVEHCDFDPIDSIRTELHAVSESLFYRGIGKKPCFVEECGTLGPMFANEEVAADFIYNNLFSNWAHGTGGFLWWCANEQTKLTHAPYDWNSVERELGLFREDGAKKPVIEAMSRFTDFANSVGILPNRIVDATCILTKGQDAWGAAYSSFILAKQAGMEIEYQYSTQPIGDSSLYLLPSLKGDNSISKHRMHELLEKVENGATLYISLESGLLSPFEEFTGLRVEHRSRTDCPDVITLDGETLTMYPRFSLKLEAVHAEVLCQNQDENPIFTSAKYGKGRVFFLNSPLETMLLTKTSAFDIAVSDPYYKIYQKLLETVNTGKVATVENANIGITEHIVDENIRKLVLINYDSQAAVAKLKLANQWKVKVVNPVMQTEKIDTCHYDVTMPKNSGVLVTISKF